MISSAAGDVLYETNFESFTAGADHLVGTDGWLSTHVGQSLHGIDDEIIPGIGKSAYLGFFRPTSAQTRTVTVLRPLNVDPIATGQPIVEFEALVGVSLSRDDPATPAVDESTRQDRFLFTIYNIAGQALASLIYDTRGASFGVWRNSGTNSFDTGFEFVANEPQFVFMSIDFENNTWSATLEGAPLFTDAVFTESGSTRNLGAIAVEWDITTPRPPRPNEWIAGNNWLLFDDWLVAAKARPLPPTEPFVISKVERTPETQVKLTYPADAGYTYHVESSTDLRHWTELPDSPVNATESNPTAVHLDPAPGTSARYYRIVREGGN